MISIISIVTSQFIPKNNLSKLEQATEKIILYLKYTRFISMVDDKYSAIDKMWFKERWTMKFQKCSKFKGGIYYVIFSDTNHKGSPNKSECLKDPITNKYLYSHYDCEAIKDESKYILLTQEFGVTNIDISCNATSTIGQISFGSDGNVYSRLGIHENDQQKYKLENTCYIDIYDKKNNKNTIAIEPITGYIHRL